MWRAFHHAVLAGCLLVISPLFLSLGIQAADLLGARTVTLHGNAGEHIVIGQIIFTARDSGYAFEFTPNRAAFEERFLAMRPFLCLEGDTYSLCHFPYRSPHVIQGNDLTDLEYQFMFLQKPRTAVSLDPKNGMYYEMRRTEKGIEGTLKEVDMTPIIVPEGDMTRPIKRENLFQVDLTRKWLPRLTVE
jgi:hypothetical protein